MALAGSGSFMTSVMRALELNEVTLMTPYNNTLD